MHVCEICGASETSTIRVADGFTVGRCKCCGLVYVKNAVDEAELRKLYRDQYFLELDETEYSGRSPDANLKRLWWFNEQRLDAIERVKKPAGLLDVGCGPGYFMVSAGRRGWRVKGVDISAKAVKFARASLGLDVTEGQLEEVLLPEGTFDLVTAWCLLEHTPNPLLTLRSIRSLLKPEGFLVLEVPNLKTIPGRLKRKRFSGPDHPKFHKYYFTHSSIHRLLAKAGFGRMTALNCRYRDDPTLRSGVKSLVKQGLRSMELDSSITVLGSP
jgi:SAM-dependent methyltransferase